MMKKLARNSCINEGIISSIVDLSDYESNIASGKTGGMGVSTKKNNKKTGIRKNKVYPCQLQLRALHVASKIQMALN